MEAIGEVIEYKSEITNRIGKRQFRWSVCEGLFYVVWHVLEMALWGRRVARQPSREVCRDGGDTYVISVV